MSYEQKSESSNIYYQIYDQKFRTRVPEGHPEALERINKLGKQVFEKETGALFGRIEDVSIEDSDFGKQIKITLDQNEDGKHPVISVGVESKNGRDLLKILPSVDFSKEVRIFPYRFKPEDKDEEISGISIAHPDDEGRFTNKVQNHFVDPETKKYLHDFPTIDWDKASEAEQKIYKIQRDAFLVKYLEDNVISKFSQEKTTDFEYPIAEGDLPF